MFICGLLHGCDLKSQPRFPLKTGCVYIFRPTLDWHYCPFLKISCLLSETSPHLSLYDISFHLTYFTQIRIPIKTIVQVSGEMAGEHTGRLHLSRKQMDMYLICYYQMLCCST